MHLAHLGVLITAIGIAVTTSESIEKDVALAIGETVTIADYQFTMTDIYETQGANFDGITADMQVKNSKNKNDNFHLFPEKRTYRIYIKPFVRFIWLGAVLMALAVVLAVIGRRKPNK